MSANSPTDRPSDGAIVERALSLANEAMFTIELQHRRLRSDEPEDRVFFFRRGADFQFLIVAFPADIWVTCHARWWGTYRKFVASTTAKNRVDPFIDPEGYRAFIDAAEAELRQGRVH